MAEARPIALVTGASSGIGAEFARQLASRGYELVITARRSDRLARLSEELNEEFGAAAHPLVADLSRDDGIEKVAARLRLGDVHLLVNNAGFGLAGAFATAASDGQEAMVSVHVLAAMRLMHEALPAMLRRAAGGVINVASLAAFVSLPGHANYSGTKAWLMRFSRAVHAEVWRQGVTVQALCPGFVITEFGDRTDAGEAESRGLPGFLRMPAPFVVRESLVAFDKGRSLVVPGAGYRLAYWIAKTGFADAILPWVARR